MDTKKLKEKRSCKITKEWGVRVDGNIRKKYGIEQLNTGEFSLYRKEKNGKTIQLKEYKFKRNIEEFITGIVSDLTFKHYPIEYGINEIKTRRAILEILSKYRTLENYSKKTLEDLLLSYQRQNGSKLEEIEGHNGIETVSIGIVEDLNAEEILGHKKYNKATVENLIKDFIEIRKELDKNT